MEPPVAPDWRGTVCHGFLVLDEHAPFGNNILQFRLDDKLYEVEARHDPMIQDGEIVEGKRILEVKVKRIA